MTDQATTPGSAETAADQPATNNLQALQLFLSSEFEAMKTNPKHARAWTFDMDDQPEMEYLSKFPRLSATIKFLGDTINPAWQAADTEAIENQRTRRRSAMFAIWPGIAAIVLAITQLALSNLVPSMSGLVTVMEISSAVLAAIAVVEGIRLNRHHRWLSRRQSAERLRSLKFQALGWHELWCDEAVWKARIETEVGRLAGVTDHDAEQWATAEDDVTPETVSDEHCPSDAAELRALASYYQFKRLKYQQAYFDRQSRKADSGSWPVRWRISLCAFFISVFVVFLHGLIALFVFLAQASEPTTAAADQNQPQAAVIDAEPRIGEATSASTGAGDERPNHENQSAVAGVAHAQDSGNTTVHSAQVHRGLLHDLEIVLISLAALIPVLAFGIRAWTSAFEYPRSRNLFRAKSYALNEPIDLIQRDSDDVKKTMRHISFSEHFLLAEHREWCRLQTESEWFV